MSAIDPADARRAALRLVLHQAVVTLLVATAFLVFAGERAAHWAISALAGGGISVVASLAMALVAFGIAPRDAKRAVRGFYRGEAVKLGLTVVLMVLALRTGAIAALPMLAAYGATLAAYWIALARS